MKNNKAFLLAFILLIPLTINAQQSPLPEGDPISTYPVGMYYQHGPGSNNTQNWTYPYGIKLTVNQSNVRNFELMTTNKHGQLVFRQWDQGIEDWTPWKTLMDLSNPIGDFTLRNQNYGLHLRVDDGGESFITNMNGFDNNGTTDNKRLLIGSQLKLRFATGSEGPFGTIRMVIDGNGNVGIKKNDPEALLDIGSNGDGTDLLKFSTDRPWVFRQEGAGAQASLVLKSLITGNKKFIVKDADGNEGFSVKVMDGDGYFKGNVGIGTDPLTKLHVKQSSSGQTADNVNGLFVENGGSSNSYYIFQTATTGGGKSFSITNAGNVGIGTTSPDHELTVNGTIHSEEVLVDLTVDGPDYVFEEDYPLQDLPSLEQYLKTNKHLPEVPSAAEMKKEGIKVGEMEMLLLKKVEELTLYIIELEKRVKELEDED